MEKDFAIKVSVRNNRILERIKALGFESQSAFARASGLNMNDLNTLVCFRGIPTSGSGWTNIAVNLATALHVEPEDLWPEHMKTLQAKKSSVEFSTDLAGVKALSAPKNTSVDVQALSLMLEKTNLTPREMDVIKRRYGLGDEPETIDTIGMGYNLNRATIAQIEHKALRKIGKTARRSRLTYSDFIETGC